MKLMALSDQFAALDALLDELGTEAVNAETGELHPTVAQWFDELGAVEADKVDRYAFYLKDLEARSTAIKGMASELTAKAKTLENRAP